MIDKFALIFIGVLCGLAAFASMLGMTIMLIEVNIATKKKLIIAAILILLCSISVSVVIYLDSYGNVLL